MRQARFLLGWVDDNIATLTFANNQTGVPLTADQSVRLKQARATVRQRLVRHEPGNVINNKLPNEVQTHVSALQQSGAANAYWAEGWQVVMADLRQVCGIQPLIFVDHAEERVAAVNPDDAGDIAKVTLPLPTSINLQPQYDTMQKAWIIDTPNLNFQILAPYYGQVPTPATQAVPGQPAINQPEQSQLVFGFVVGAHNSFLQVAKFHGKYVLRDGNHRAYALLRRGISIVPALFREFGPHQELGVGPAGLLQAEAYLGERPPLLTDYLDDTVSIEVAVPAPQRIIVIPGLQLSQNK